MHQNNADSQIKWIWVNNQCCDIINDRPDIDVDCILKTFRIWLGDLKLSTWKNLGDVAFSNRDNLKISAILKVITLARWREKHVFSSLETIENYIQYNM